MAMKTSKLLFVVFVLLWSSQPSLSHVYSPGAIFTYSLHPDSPLQKFAQGELGILQPTYARSYLYVAYRYMIGVGFDQEEQKAVMDVWSKRLGTLWVYSEVVDMGSHDGQEWIKNWLDARSKVPQAGPPPEIEVYKYVPDSVACYLCYPKDAFQTAERTLNERIEKFGADSPEVLDWVRAQDMVFANWSDVQHIPDPAKPGADPLIQADRTYQIAAANFYACNFDVAERMFREIASDSSSPWRQIAPYLVARTLLRSATLSAGPGETDMETLTKAEAQLKRILSDNSLSAIHPPAQELLNRIRILLEPEETLQDLARILLEKNLGENLKQYLLNYTKLLDNFGAEDDLTDWVFTFQAKDNNALDHAVQKWSETSSLPWLVASLSKVSRGHPRLAELLKAGERVESDSPAFTTIAFHSIRLMIESGRKEEARKRLDSLLSKGDKTFPPSSLNLFLAERMKVARNLDEFLKYAPRVPAAITYGYDSQELPEDLEKDELLKVYAGGRALLDADSARTLTECMPLSLLKESATSKVLPIQFRREIAIAAWVRSVLLNNEAIGKELVPVLENLVPELKEYLEVYLSAKDSEARKFAAVFLILKFPGVRPYVRAGLERLNPVYKRLISLDKIDSLRDNWWCSFSRDAQHYAQDYYLTMSWVSGPLRVLYPDDKFESPDFLNDAQKTSAKEEWWEKLSSIETAPNYLCSQVIDWAKKKPNDPRVPEALHLAVKSTRYGCTDEKTSNFSKQAFQILHRRYPKSSWAGKTKYWY